MVLKWVFRYSPAWPKVRICRFIWEGGSREFMAGTPNSKIVVGSQKLAIALRPRLFAWERESEGWRLCVAGVEIHRSTSWGGRYV
jgi:hypothetical protein